jgi:hypothetical protein
MIFLAFAVYLTHTLSWGFLEYQYWLFWLLALLFNVSCTSSEYGLGQDFHWLPILASQLGRKHCCMALILDGHSRRNFVALSAEDFNNPQLKHGSFVSSFCLGLNLSFRLFPLSCIFSYVAPLMQDIFLQIF